MTLQQIHYVIEIEKSGSFCEGANRCFITQPSISNQVRELEEELGITIFHRSRSGVTLTPDGQEFLKYAYQILEAQETLMSHFSNKNHARVNFSVSSLHYAFVLNAFQAMQLTVTDPRYYLRINETTMSGVIRDIAKYESEIGVIFLSDSNQKLLEKNLKANRIRFHPLSTVDTCIFIAEGHPLLKKGYATLEDLSPYPSIIYDQASYYFTEETPVANFTPDKVISVTNIHASKVLMQTSLGYNIGSGITKQETSVIKSIPLRGVSKMTIGYLQIENTQLSPLAETFLQLLREQLEDL